MLSCKLSEIYVVDLPRFESWYLAKFETKDFDPNTMLLNHIRILLVHGEEFPKVVRLGHHRIARLLEKFGNDQVVTYEPQSVDVGKVDRDVEVAMSSGVATLPIFLSHCVNDVFLGDNYESQIISPKLQYPSAILPACLS